MSGLGDFRGAEIHRPGFGARRADRVDLGSGRSGEAEALRAWELINSAEGRPATVVGVMLFGT